VILDAMAAIGQVANGFVLWVERPADQPIEVNVGGHTLTPACSMLMHQAIPNPEMRVFDMSSHSPFEEEPEAYRQKLPSILKRYRRRV